MRPETKEKLKSELIRLSYSDKPAHLRQYVEVLRARHPEVFREERSVKDAIA